MAPTLSNPGKAVTKPISLAHVVLKTSPSNFKPMRDFYLTFLGAKVAHENDYLWCVNHGPTTSIYYYDPDGSDIETQVDNFESAEEANVFMRSEMFERNPIGTDFDPEDLIKRIEAGEHDSMIKKRVEIGARGVPVF